LNYDRKPFLRQLTQAITVQSFSQDKLLLKAKKNVIRKTNLTHAMKSEL